MKKSSALRTLRVCCSVLAFGANAHATLPPLPPGDVLAQDIASAPLDTESATVINWLAANGGWNSTNRMLVDFSIEVNDAAPGTATLPVTQGSDYFLPDCDTGVNVPIPPGGAIEGQTGYQCLGGGDCHLLVHDASAHRLYELYAADITGGVLHSQCAVVWELAKTYSPLRRGLQCTSTDPAGLPVAPLLFDADEVASGQIAHAIRFSLPNARIRAGTFVLPATHAGGPSGPSSAPPYGVRLRLKSTFQLASLPNDAARVVARAMQKYGIVLADGGNITLTARSDRFTTAKWANLMDSHALQSLAVTDFEMVAAGTRYPLTFDCVREPPPASPIAARVPFQASALLAVGLAGAAWWTRRKRA